MADNTTPSKWIQRVGQELRRDKKRTVVLGAVAAVALVVACRAAWRSVPITAAASSTGIGQQSAIPSESRTNNEQFEREAHRNDYLKRMDTVIARDVFRPNLDCFPMQKNHEVVRVLPTTTSAPADVRRRRELARASSRRRQRPAP